MQHIDVTDPTRTAHASSQAYGLLLMAVAFVGLMSFVLAAYGGEDLGPFPVVAVVVAGVTALVWKVDRTWASIVGLVVTLLGGAASFYLAFGVFHLFSPIEFISGLLFLVGFFWAIIGGFRAIRARRRSAPTTEREARIRRATSTVIAVASVVSVVGFFATRSTVSSSDAAGATTVGMKNFTFTPDSLEVASGSTLLLENTDGFTHDFTISDLGVEVDVGPGSESLVDLSGLAPGTYQFVCTLHSSDGEGMIGTITIDS